MSSDESGDVHLDQKGVWYRGQTEQVPGQSPEEHRKKREQDQTLDRWWRQFEFCWTGIRRIITVQYRVYQKHAQDDDQLYRTLLKAQGPWL